MNVNLNLSIKIVVIENDIGKYSEFVIEESCVRQRFDTKYFLENRQGLSFARNRSVKESGDCDFCCFVDDDQIVSLEWMVELMRCQQEFDSDGVWGCNPPIFEKDVPPYILKFHTAQMHSYGEVVGTAATNSLLLRKSILDKIEGPFNLRFNFTSGEDSYMTWLFTKLGGVIRFNPNAIAYEVIPGSRTSMKYVIKRTYSISNRGLFVYSLRTSNFPVFRIFMKLLLKMLLGLVIAAPYLIFGKEDRLKGVLKVSDAFGGFAFLVGRHYEFYK